MQLGYTYTYVHIFTTVHIYAKTHISVKQPWIQFSSYPTVVSNFDH